jgi:hypothetical protein
MLFSLSELETPPNVMYVTIQGMYNTHHEHTREYISQHYTISWTDKYVLSSITDENSQKRGITLKRPLKNGVTFPYRIGRLECIQLLSYLGEE